jgi:hypothetical protein
MIKRLLLLLTCIASVAAFLMLPADAHHRSAHARKPRPTTTTVPVTTTTVPPTTTTTAPGGGVTPEQFGAVANDGVDDSAALQAMFNSCPANMTLGGTYHHNRVLIVPCGTVYGGALNSTVPTASAVKFRGSAGANNVTFRSNATTRGNTLEHQKVVLEGSGQTLAYIRVEGSHTAGIFTNRASDFNIIWPQVFNTQADCIHMTNGSTRGHIVDSLSSGCGDDGVAVVSYLSDGVISSDITVDRPVVRSNRGRGLAVVGGLRVSFNDVDIDNTMAAGIYISREPAPWYTYNSTTIRVNRGTVSRANYDCAIDHGAILFYAEGGRIDDAVVDGVNVTNPVGCSDRYMAAFFNGNIGSSAFRNITVYGAPRTHLVYNLAGVEVTNVRYG